MEPHTDRCKQDRDMTDSSETVGRKIWKTLHEGKTCPWEPAVEVVSWTEKSWSLNLFTLSGDPEGASAGHMVGKDCCAEPTLMLLETPCLSIFLHSQFQENEKLHFASEIELNEKWRLDIGQARPLGDKLYSHRFGILWHRVDEKRAFLWQSLLEAGEKNANFFNPRFCPQEIMSAEKTQSHDLQPESGNIQAMATVVIPILASLVRARNSGPGTSLMVPVVKTPHCLRRGEVQSLIGHIRSHMLHGTTEKKKRIIDLKQPVFLGWKSNPHTWWPSPSISLKWPHVNLGSRNLFMPVNQPVKNAGGTELVGLSDGSGRWLLAVWQPQTHSGWPLGEDSDCDRYWESD